MRKTESRGTPARCEAEGSATSLPNVKLKRAGVRDVADAGRLAKLTHYPPASISRSLRTCASGVRRIRGGEAIARRASAARRGLRTVWSTSSARRSQEVGGGACTKRARRLSQQQIRHRCWEGTLSRGCPPRKVFSFSE